MPQMPESTLKENTVRGDHNFSCAIYQSALSYRGSLTKYHWHDELEILYFTGGDYLLEINMTPFHITSECLFFVNPGELHRISTLQKFNYPTTSIVFDLGILRSDNMDEAELQILSPVLRKAMSFPRLLTPEDSFFPEALTFFEKFTDLVHVKAHPLIINPNESLITRPSDQLLAKAYFLQLIAQLYEGHYFEITEPGYNKKVESIKASLTYIKDHYQEKIHIHDLAAEVGMNEQYFCRFFKNAIGHSPMEYVNEYRIRNAVNLLEKTSLSVTDICMESGFNNLGNFIKEFKKETGTTPLRYRKNAENRRRSI